MNTNRPLRRTAATAAVAVTTALVLGACGDRKFTPIADQATATVAATPDTTPTTVAATAAPEPPEDPGPPETTAPEPIGTTPGIHAAVSARQALTVSEASLASLGAAVVHDPGEPPTVDVVATWIAELTRLERALDADAIRALGDDPLFEQIAGPVGELDAATIRVIGLLDPPTGEPDILAALVEVQVAVAAWEAAVPGMEAAWEDAVARWTSEWELAVADWEQEWAEAVAEWEAEWAAAVAEWELEWAAAVAEWEAEWAAAVAEWEQEWAAAVAEWEQAWQDAIEEWQEEQRRRRGDDGS